MNGSSRFGSIVVEIAKLRDYCLSDTHPRGRHKARVFRSRLGLSADDAVWLRRALLHAAHDRQDALLPTGADNATCWMWRSQLLPAAPLSDPPGLFWPAGTCYG